MAYKDTGAEIEFICLVEGEPVVIGAGAKEEVITALEEGSRLNEGLAHPAGEVISPGTYYSMGKLSRGLCAEAAAGLATHASFILDSIEAQRRAIAEGSEPATE